MEIAGWILVIALFVVGMAGAIFPILPGALAIYAAFFVYGFFISFSPFGFWFWTIQTLIVIVLFVADYAVSAWGVKKYGGSRASVIGSTIGVLVGPFVIPAFGLILGPLIGAVAGELFTGAGFEKSLKAGLGAVVGLFTSTVVKFILQGAMIVAFFIWI
ncbi:hypothetical protein SAMN02799624_02610 [Paenibacillus sp. UNC496MF]|uniref:DUF456 domain-containing protein n=1 Tax=Paenibacillus sp. UNC496MF TaxID=1502753 RepID=UPI0008ED3BD6|nr:DUF456 family protein [Paenibacillus sp. UNC496MF]SFI90723.1 hypothetical protein SAMN02799624_02610 [Paenibacillus sp. UNC496MF]